ncbi:hypothetical protein [Cysteiniphilum halobium]|uniref:hypothetical protein n=1 Tax=Cysteiniphilum halobium TaxID=2219059 RepID=UPI000E6470AD|nr:hypothetical protein [Cysteiniphilum halobium]
MNHKKIISLALLTIAGSSYANNVHTSHHIYALNDSSDLKPWNVRITSIAPNEMPYFVSGIASSDDMNFSVTKSSPVDYGFGFKVGSDFNVAYTITAIDTSKNADASQHKTKSCTFVVGANGPANPNIVVENYEGAKCNWKDNTGQGVDFYLE